MKIIIIGKAEREAFRKTYEFKKWHKDVLKRDKYTCQYCKEHYEILNAHHINGYNWDIEHRTDIDNGVTLCKNCHKDFHSIYGYGNNTKKQYEDWIGNNKIEYIKDVNLQIN